MFPLVDFTDNSRHEPAQLILNACIPDFIRCEAQMENQQYRRTLLSELNGLSQNESYFSLDRAEKILANLAVKKPEPTSRILETLRAIMPVPSEPDSRPDPTSAAERILCVSERLSSLRRQINNEAFQER
jgi:hypothetical protein